MKNLKTQTHVAGMAIFVLGILLSSFSIRPGGYSYSLHLNSKLVSEHYLTPKAETPSLSLTEQNMKGTLGVLFNECGSAGVGRKLSLRTVNEKIIKEWSFTNSSNKNDPMEIDLKSITSSLSGKVGLFYTSDIVTKPQILVYLVPNANKEKVVSR